MIQPKLEISKPGDQDEQEADHVAEHVMRMPEPVSAESISLTAPVSLQPKCACGGTCDKCQANRKEDDHDHEELQRSPAELVQQKSGVRRVDTSVQRSATSEVLQRQPKPPQPKPEIKFQFGWLTDEGSPVETNEQVAAMARLAIGVFR